MDNKLIRKTKIICTLGPATDDESVLRKLMLEGMNTARINFSHGTYEEHLKKIEMVKKLRAELDLPVALLLDTKGPEIRIKTFKDGRVNLKAGQLFTLTPEEVEGDETRVSVTYGNLAMDVTVGGRILIDDGLIAMKVVDIKKNDVICEVLNEGSVSNRKSINIPGASLSMPYISERDKNDIIFGIENGFDFIAASFVRSAYDIIDIKKILEQNGGTGIQIIAKIENSQGVQNIDEIIRISDGIMVARGDMGVEIDFEELPAIQKKLIENCFKAGKKVITATQMLESMTHNPRPTRAEASDVANAVYDGTSAVMLSGETAAGAYPVESLKTMVRIIQCTERDINYKNRFARNSFDCTGVTSAIGHSTCTTAHDLEAAAIITVTRSGYTSRMVSGFRPACPIIAAVRDERARRQLNLSWGVFPILSEEKSTIDELFEHAVECAMKTNLISNGDLVVITGGSPVGISGTTNVLKVHLVGDILVSGTGINKLSVSGNVCIAHNENEALRKFRDGDILVISETSNMIISILKKASGIITEKAGIASHAAIVGMTLDIPVICGAENAVSLLKDGTVVTIDANRGFVYSGVTKVL